MQAIYYNSLAATSWKNGGGETREIAAFPPGAGFDAFDWRLSIATIGEDGTFSAFPGIERTLFLLTGAGVVLQVDDEAEYVLRPGDRLSFAGEQRVQSRLLDGPVQDLNLMLRRGRATAATEAVRLDGRAHIALGQGGGAIVLFDGQACQADGTELAARDTILASPADAAPIALTGQGKLVLIRFG